MLASQIKTASQLRSFTESYGTVEHFWDRKTMKFFGDTMANYGVRRITIISNYDQNMQWHEQGVEREVFELYRRKPVKYGNQKSVYFCANTFLRVFPKE